MFEYVKSNTKYLKGILVNKTYNSIMGLNPKSSLGSKSHTTYFNFTSSIRFVNMKKNAKHNHP